jgi:hypothetical protein
MALNREFYQNTKSVFVTDWYTFGFGFGNGPYVNISLSSVSNTVAWINRLTFFLSEMHWGAF